MFLLLFVLASARRRRNKNSDGDLATNQRILKKLAKLFDDSLAAQKAAGDQAVRVVRETTDNFRVLMRRVQPHKIQADYRYEKMSRDIAFKIFQVRFYLKLLAEELVPARDMKRQLDKELKKLERTLGSVKLEGKHN